MLQRVLIHSLLILLFAFTQIGVVTHEISHFNEVTKHSKQDKNTPVEQCGKCISYSQVASGLQSQVFTLASFDAKFEVTSSYYFNNQSSLQTAYAARAPPQTISI